METTRIPRHTSFFTIPTFHECAQSGSEDWCVYPLPSYTQRLGCDYSNISVARAGTDTQCIAAHNRYVIVSAKRDSCLLYLLPVVKPAEQDEKTISMRSYKSFRFPAVILSQMVLSFDVNPLDERSVIVGGSDHSLIVWTLVLIPG